MGYSFSLEEVIAFGPGPVYSNLQLFQCQEDENGGWLEPSPCRYPSLEHEHRTIGFHGLTDDPHS